MWGFLRKLLGREALLLSAPLEEEMANEITLNASLDFDSGSTSDRVSVVNLKQDSTSVDFVHTVQSIAAAEATLQTQAITLTNAWLICVNRSTTGRVELRATSGGTALVRLPPGGVAMFQSDVATIYAISPDAAPLTKLEFFAVEA